MSYGIYQRINPIWNACFLKSKATPIRVVMTESVGKFVPKTIAQDNTFYPVYCRGRSFAGHDSISDRKKWHALSKSINVNKESETFPEEWVKRICGFIQAEYPQFARRRNLMVSVVPHRPERISRLENLLNQFESYVLENPFPNSARVSFELELLAYKECVLSNHMGRLTAKERFENVREHLYVLKPEAVRQGEMVVVIDDVCTRGASLIYAGKFLESAGSSEVRLLTVSMNIGEVIYD